MNRQRAELAGGALDVEALQRGRPGIEHGAAMMVIDLAHQIVKAVGIDRDVMVILYAEDHIEFGGAIGGFPEGRDDHVPLALEGRRKVRGIR